MANLWKAINSNDWDTVENWNVREKPIVNYLLRKLEKHRLRYLKGRNWLERIRDFFKR